MRGNGNISCQSLKVTTIFWIIFLFVASTAKMPQHARDLIGSVFILPFSFGYKELKVGREYMVNVFNGFINA
jgi:hypothetical protein